MKDGPKKGEVQEMKFAVARDLINLGRAVKYEDEAPTPQPQLLPIADDIGQPEPAKTKKKKK